VKVPASVRDFFGRRVVTPLLNLLRKGATPDRLAWSLAVGVAIGLNPILGTTTVLALIAAFVFRLNVIATQITNHLVFPLQLILIVAYLRVGEMVFRTGHLTLTSSDLRFAVEHHEWDKARMLWTWQWHAVIVWLAAAVIVTPLLALALKPLLERLLFRLQHQPIVEK
jgi:uncharacterized protein (DUF2062 family)